MTIATPGIAPQRLPLPVKPAEEGKIRGERTKWGGCTAGLLPHNKM
jgi:hypothetical protein